MVLRYHITTGIMIPSADSMIRPSIDTLLVFDFREQLNMAIAISSRLHELRDVFAVRQMKSR